MALSIGDRRLGAILLEQGYVNDSDLQRALERHSEVGGRLAEVLIGAGVVGEKRIARAIEEALGIPLVSLPAVQPDPEALRSIQPQTAQSLLAFPFALEGETLRVALVDPLSSFSLETLEDDSGLNIEAYQALREEVMWALASYYPELGLEVPSLGGVSGEGETGRLGERLIARGLITDAQLQVALDAQQQTGEALGHTLVAQGALSEDQLYEVLAEREGATFVADPSGYAPPEAVLGSLLRADALRLCAVPVEETAFGVTVVTSDPRKRGELAALIGKPVELLLARPHDVEGLIERLYPQRGRLGETLVQVGALSREQLREALQVQAREGKVKPLGEVITELGFASPDEVDAALVKQNNGGGRLEDTLVQSGKLSPEMLARSLAAQLGYEFLDPVQNPPDPKVALLVPESTARRYVVVPVRMQGAALVVAMKDPRNVFALDDLKLITGKDILPAVMAEKDIVRLIERYFGEKGFEKLNKELADKARTQQSQEIDLTTADESAIVQVVDSVIREAALQEASDIHIETTQDAVKVRYRVDGILREQNSFPKAAGQSIMARLKIMGALDIAERRVPQDGRIRFRRGSIDLDLRLSTLPTVYGEKAVMRLLQKASNIPELEQLGFSPYNFGRYSEVIEKPNGIFLVTGPTGSGKSFTCFSTLKRIARPEKNTTTIEDPIEYEVPGIVQSQVNNAAGMTFARALRAFLRQDPDIIFVGEIRDQETAKIAVEAALTGHLVLATLHTNDAPGAVVRLEEMGIEHFNIAASVIGVLAQRLVRRVCSECKQPTNADPEVLRRLGIGEADLQGATLVRGAGCPRCNGTGYKGRMGIHELMVIDDMLRRTISAGKTATEIRDVALGESGMRSLRADGIDKALQGLTTLEEVLAVTAS